MGSGEGEEASTSWASTGGAAAPGAAWRARPVLREPPAKAAVRVAETEVEGEGVAVGHPLGGAVAEPVTAGCTVAGGVPVVAEGETPGAAAGEGVPPGTGGQLSAGVAGADAAAEGVGAAGAVLGAGSGGRTVGAAGAGGTTAAGRLVVGDGLGVGLALADGEDAPPGSAHAGAAPLSSSAPATRIQPPALCAVLNRAAPTNAPPSRSPGRPYPMGPTAPTRDRGP
ncbi:hypothetical protein GCM10009665_45980 [Kitasatospora nipponensis]|uniref:Uncharacterized protein n=1 Tax=Kitasatospora nipponensis TaxID=258049 RepID=A0ABN1WKP0_9ACTN